MYIKYKKYFTNQQGIGLIEVLASFTIAIVVITSLVSLSLSTVRSSLNSKLLLEGTKIASREIERVRGFRDSSLTWVDFLDAMTTSNCVCAATPCARQCHMNSPVLAPASNSIDETIDNQVVTRYFNIIQTAANPDLVRVSVYVTWNVGGVAKSTHVYTDLTNWQNK